MLPEDGSTDITLEFLSHRMTTAVTSITSDIINTSTPTINARTKSKANSNEIIDPLLKKKGKLVKQEKNAGYNPQNDT